MQKVLIVTLLVGLLLPFMAVADECTDGDCVNGQGTMIYSDGKKQEGMFEDGAFVGN